MGTADIIKALVKDAKSTRAYGGSELVELGMSTNSFTAYIDESCLGKNTTNPQKTISEVKWFLLRQHVWDNYKQLYPELGKNDFFNKLLTELNSGDYNVLSGNNLNVTREMVLKGNTTGNLGAIYMLMPYVNFPEYDIENIFVVALAQPQILYAQFKFPQYGYIPLENQEKKAAYGQTVDAVVYTHLLPDWRKNLMKFEFEVELINKGEVVSKSGLRTMGHGGDFNYNNKVIIKFQIDIDWQKNHKDRNKDEEFYLRIVGTEKFSKATITTPEISYNTGQYDSENDSVDWMRMEEGKWVYDTSRVLLVPYDNFSDMMSRYEVQKNNMIQYIGDIKYLKQEFDPCGYSKITIQDKEDKERKPFVIFDETKPSGEIDKTDHIFAIIAGDERKDITITLDGLKTKNQFCQGLLLDDGQKHTEHKNVFQVDKIYSAVRTKDGYTTRQDTTHQEQQRNADITTNEENKTDTDVIKSDKVYNPSAAQQWQDGVDYKIVSDKEITLKLRYLYNKTVLEGKIQNKYVAELINNLWLFNYFILTENMGQTFFLPISTCRYPNQIVKIKLYPDISWTFHLNYGMKNPLYYRDTWVEMRQHRVDDAVNRAQASDIEGYDGTVETKFGLSIEAKWNSDTVKLDQKISEKIKLFVGSFIKIKQFVDKVTGRDRGRSTEGAQNNRLSRMRRYPLSIEVLSPQISIGAGWQYKFGRQEKGENNILVPTLGLVAKADPAIGAEAVIDLIAWGKKLHPAAEAVITALDLLLYASNASVRFDLKFYGKLVIEGNIELSRLKKEGELKAEGQFGFELTLQAKATGKLETWWNEVDYNFEAKAEGSGYFSLGLALGLDDYKGLYFQPIVRHSGIKITLVLKAEIGSINRGKTKTFTIIEADKMNFDTKHYIND